MRLVALLVAFTAICAAQITQYPNSGGGGGSGTVTSVGLVGTANQITVTGTSPITGAGTFTLSLPNGLILPNGTTATTQSPGDNSTKVATTAYVDTHVGGVTSVGLVGTANQIAVTGCTSPITSSGSCTFGFTATPVLPNGTTATTQSPGDGTTKVATDAFVAAAISGISSAGASGAVQSSNGSGGFLDSGCVATSGNSTCTTFTTNGGSTGTVQGGPAVSGTNQTGNDIIVAGGQGTGSANGGSVFVKNSLPGSSGTSANALTNSVQVSGATGNVEVFHAMTVDGHVTLEGVTSAGATGTVNLVFSTSPTLTTPNLGTPSAATLTNATGLPLLAGVTGKTKSCVVVTGDPGAASPVLANDNDSPVACDNDLGADWTITSVSCWADAGSPTVTPILTGGTGTSILTGPLACGTTSWAGGTVNGSPVVHSFAGASCSSTPCSIDSNITTAGGTAKYIVVKIVGTY